MMIDTSGSQPVDRKTVAEEERIRVDLADQEYFIADSLFNEKAKKTFELDLKEQQSIINNDADSQLALNKEYTRPQEELDHKQLTKHAMDEQYTALERLKHLCKDRTAAVTLLDRIMVRLLERNETSGRRYQDLIDPIR